MSTVKTVFPLCAIAREARDSLALEVSRSSAPEVGERAETPNHSPTFPMKHAKESRIQPYLRSEKARSGR